MQKKKKKKIQTKKSTKLLRSNNTNKHKYERTLNAPWTRLPNLFSGSPRGVMAKVLDCGLEVSEFELESIYFVYFRIKTLAEFIELNNSPSSYGNTDFCEIICIIFHLHRL